MSKAGKTVTNGHLDRLRLLDAGQEAFNEVLQSQDVVQSSWDAQVDREERVAQVMWAINFARTALLVPQDVLDRNLAEMIVGAEMDLKLF